MVNYSPRQNSAKQRDYLFFYQQTGKTYQPLPFNVSPVVISGYI